MAKTRKKKRRKPRTIVAAGKKKTFRMTVPRNADLSRHDLGQISPEVLMREAQISARMVKRGYKEMENGEYGNAMDLFFKGAAVATNVIFTARIHGMRMTPSGDKEMIKIVNHATRGMKMVIKCIIRKKMKKHELIMHS